MHWPSFFSWKIETVLFFLAEKEENGFKKKVGEHWSPTKHKPPQTPQCLGWFDQSTLERNACVLGFCG